MKQRINRKHKRLNNGKKHIMFNRLVSRDGRKCISCGALDDLTIDHKLALCLGGTNNIKNLQLLCGECNRRKGFRENVESLKRQGTKWIKSRKRSGTFLSQHKRMDEI